MPDFNKLEDEAKNAAQQHPDQVKQGEEHLEKEMGVANEQQGQGQPEQQAQGQPQQSAPPPQPDAPQP